MKRLLVLALMLVACGGKVYSQVVSPGSYFKYGDVQFDVAVGGKISFVMNESARWDWVLSEDKEQELLPFTGVFALLNNDGSVTFTVRKPVFTPTPGSTPTANPTLPPTVIPTPTLPAFSPGKPPSGN